MSTHKAAAALTAEQVLARLEAGNERFVRGEARFPTVQKDILAELAKGQQPYATIIGCSDSRVPPELVFQQGIGDVFSVRVAGNVIDTDDLGSLEYATKAVGVRLIVVMGHTECGAVKGAIDDVKLGNLTELLSKIRQAAASAGAPGTSKDAAYVDKIAEANVRLSMRELREKSPVMKELIDSGKTGLVGAMYDVKTGKVAFLAD